MVLHKCIIIELYSVVCNIKITLKQLQITDHKIKQGGIKNIINKF